MDENRNILNSCLNQFRDTQEAKMLFYYRSRENRFTFDERMSVTRSIEKSFSPMFLDMKAESPSLSESDLIYCALVAVGLSPVVIADCISISKDSLRMRKIRVKEKLSQSWVELLFPQSDPDTATKSATEKCDNNVAQHNSQAQKHAILLPQNQLNEKVMETKKVTFGQAIKTGIKNMFRFSGRASRSEFWYFILFYAIILTAIPFLIRILYMLSMIIDY